jgi:hypothetical protein
MLVYTLTYLKKSLFLLIGIVFLLSCTFDPSGLSEVSNNNNVNNTTNNINNINAVCPNGVAESGESCDGADLKGFSCITLGFDGGTLGCLSDCSDHDTSSCEGTGPVCNNNHIEGTEVCDGVVLSGETCVTQGFTSGDLVCLSDCKGFDTSGCEGTGPVCNNNTIEGAEQCDGSNLGIETCVTQGFFAGDLSCLFDCTGFNTNACVNNICGNGTIEGVESCDGTDLEGQDCTNWGFIGGVLACMSDCSGFDILLCTDFVCGNHTIEGPETCDMENVNGVTCQDYGCRSGVVVCSSDCHDYDISGCMTGHDEDGDGIDDNCDNCPSYFNAGQADSDGDGVGNLCDAESPYAFVDTVQLFDPMLSSSSDWEMYPIASGTWSYNSDEINGSAIFGSNYIFDDTLPSSEYSVETTFSYPNAPGADNNWVALVFGWQTGIGGVMQSSYECTYERETKNLGLYRYNLSENSWNGMVGKAVSTSVSDGQWHKLRAFSSGTNLRCVYEDETGVVDEINFVVQGAYTDRSGQAGIRIYRERAIFTSFVIYY